MGLDEGGDLERAREGLLELLSEYAIAKKSSLLVIFDGQRSIHSGGSEARKGVRALFTGPGETADDRIAALTSQLREKALVITSDRGLVTRIETHLSGHATVEEFLVRLDETLYMAVKGGEEEDDIERRREKKGPSHKQSKKTRKKKRYMNKL